MKTPIERIIDLCKAYEEYAKKHMEPGEDKLIFKGSNPIFGDKIEYMKEDFVTVNIKGFRLSFLSHNYSTMYIENPERLSDEPLIDSICVKYANRLVELEKQSDPITMERNKLATQMSKLKVKYQKLVAA